MHTTDHYILPHPDNTLRWCLNPQRKKQLIQTVLHTQQHLPRERRVQILRETAIQYVQWLVDVHMYTDTGGQTIIRNLRTQRQSKALRAALHRFHCELLRILAGGMPCPHLCCCQCPAAPARIECNAWLLFLRSTKPETRH